MLSWQCGQNIFFIESNAIVVADRERAQLAGQDRRLTIPCESAAQIDDLAKNAVYDSAAYSFAEGIFRNAARNRDFYRQAVEDMKRDGSKAIENIRTTSLHKPVYDNAVRNLFRNFGKKGTYAGQRSTELFSRLLIEAWIDRDVARKADLDENDTIDFMHACVPSMYCDYISLDRRWAYLVNKTRRKMSNRGTFSPLATTIKPNEAGLLGLVRELNALPIAKVSKAQIVRAHESLSVRAAGLYKSSDVVIMPSTFPSVPNEEDAVLPAAENN